MELTAKTLQEVTFGAKVRGYDPPEVDEFLAMVAEGVEELRERLRRAVERANHAEQQLAQAQQQLAHAQQQLANAENAAASVVQPVQTATGTSGAAGEISKVWERAAAAAEAAVEEAKAEAYQLLQEAHEEAESSRTGAREEADALVSRARQEAERISTEAQAQLRSEIAQLESAREQLKEDVDRLAGYLDQERERVRAALSRALSVLEDNASEASPPPVTSVHIPSTTERQWQQDIPEESGQAESSEDEYDSRQSLEQTHGGWQQFSDHGFGHAQHSWSDAEHAENEQPRRSPEYDRQEPRQESRQEQGWRGYDGYESDQQDADPFLAELRRAVQEDEPLGPRDEDEEADSIDHLYANDDDDRSGFFRRKK